MSGDRIVMRSVWEEKIQAAWPVTVVSDSVQALVLYLAAGTTYKIRDFSGRLDGRMPVGEWELVDREWKSDMLRIMLPGDNHAYLGFWDRCQRFDRWYINLEREHERTKYGIDFVDHFLDIVIRPDTNEWRWKDEEELDHAVSRGLIIRQQAGRIREEGYLALKRWEAGTMPFGQGWEFWRPNPDWSIPSLPPGWNG